MRPQGLVQAASMLDVILGSHASYNLSDACIYPRGINASELFRTLAINKLSDKLEVATTVVVIRLFPHFGEQWPKNNTV